MTEQSTVLSDIPGRRQPVATEGLPELVAGDGEIGPGRFDCAWLVPQVSEDTTV